MADHRSRHRDPLPHREVRDPRALRALAHPLRQRMLELLHRSGPATATTMARALRQNTGATSYHLRQLARYGLVAVDRHRGNHREVWWQAVHGDFRFGHGLRDRAGRAASDALLLTQVSRDGEILAAYLRQKERHPEWRDIEFFSHSSLHLTPAELRRFGADIIALIKRYYRPESLRSAEAIPVRMMLYAFPWPEPDGRG